MTQLALTFIDGGEADLPALPVLPPLPPLMRYYDDYARTERTLRGLSESEWTVHLNGTTVAAKFQFASPWVSEFVKLAVVEAVLRLSPATAINYFNCYRAIDTTIVTEVAHQLGLHSPAKFREAWTVRFRDALTREQAVSVRHLARTACRLEIGGWRNADSAVVRGLPGHFTDKYAGVRDGSSFLSVRSRSLLVEFIDSVTREIQAGCRDGARIQSAAILAIAFQHGLRTKQIASLEPQVFKFFADGALHVRIELIKQRGAKTGRRVTRRIQPGWVVIFAAWMDLRPAATTKFSGLRPDQIGSTIQDATESVTGTAYSARDLRHTAAQRLVDAGASRESVSDFLGHTDTTAADVYFTSSPTQAAMVNAALGYSPTYQAIAAAGRGELIRRHSC